MSLQATEALTSVNSPTLSSVQSISCTASDTFDKSNKSDTSDALVTLVTLVDDLDAPDDKSTCSHLMSETDSVQKLKSRYEPERTHGIHHVIDPDGFLDYHKQVHISMFAENRDRVVDVLRQNCVVSRNSAIVLQGGKDFHQYDTDCDFNFKQESFFAYMFAISEPNCYGAIDLENNESILFVPSQDTSDAIWMGPIKTTDFYRQKYGVDKCYRVEDLPEVLTERGVQTLYLPKGVNMNSGRENEPVVFANIDMFEHNYKDLTPAMCEARVIKSEKELNLMRFINTLSSNAHKHVMKIAKTCVYERGLEAEFLHYINMHYGCRHVSYGCICCSGHNGAILHYGHAGAPNDRKLQDSDMLLLDMGAEYYNYGSDITCSFPKSGKFTDDQKLIYNAVLDSQLEVERNVKAGVSWRTLQRISEVVIVKHLVDIGVVVSNGLTVEQLVDEHNIARLFMPHSFGHLLGMDVHDVDSHHPHYPDELTAMDNTLLSRKDSLLRSGMVITVEPGIYFNEALLLPILSNPDDTRYKYLNSDRVISLMNFGGVRLEDDVIVKDDGCELMTKVPKSVDEIEELMK
ncbi:xaa-Pro dipeptidase [Yasminevirus sp. GU-2018]|uniref:Xaa-Pro dipeptidase n=1 Tax=Yasminevirus sp. GU-2018 TaxID=2420051 RepID=A0A5K0U8Z3_9VIRU|nr:xaa-Pro dipeptidase [Yasminevirus sp. GU-2018]